ncbi:MAG: glycosyl hydrolase family 18 protein [Crocinitomicaceae bacterium]|nr:glycosyl hydrolase family 18 protein [Crocinitomicaceae bacterium]
MGLLLSLNFYSQDIPYQKSIHQTQLEEYNSKGNANAAFYEKTVPAQQKPAKEKSNCSLNKIVYGWHPYWVGSVYQNYEWDLLSHLSYFSYEVNASDGEAVTTHGWANSSAVDAALASGNTKVTLTASLFSNHAAFFNSSTSEQTLINNLISLVQNRGAHGVNIDFEGLPSSYKTNFANFMVNLCSQMHAAIPGSEVSTVLYAVDWNNVFDFSIMEPEVDHYIIMGYAYYYQGSSNTGPCDPLYHYGTNYNYTLSKSVTDYLHEGCPANKLVLGLPYYGYQWATTDLNVPGTTIASGNAKTFKQVKNNASNNYTTSNLTYESDSYTNIYLFNDGGPQQCFISEFEGFDKRLSHVLNTKIAGIGIWALGYDDGYNGCWNSIENYLTDCYEDSCNGSIHDYGGPSRNYYNNENYTWTISPPNASNIDVDFTFFDVEANYDYLYIYDGADTNASQIPGSPFTDTIGPGSFTSSTGSVTFRFYSDVATKNPGFLANYSCNYSGASLNETHSPSIYPNPSNHSLNIVGFGIEWAELYNQEGKLIQKTKCNPSLQKASISMRDFSRGVYYLKTTSSQNIQLQKIIKN